MVIQKIKELARLEAQVVKLEAQVSLERLAELASLHESYGYDDLKAFIAALKQSAGRKPKGKKTKAGKLRKQKRAKITPEIKAQVKAALAAGKTAVAVAKEVAISHASVQNIKKELGLVKARAGTAAPAVALTPA